MTYPEPPNVLGYPLTATVQRVGWHHWYIGINGYTGGYFCWGSAERAQRKAQRKLAKMVAYEARRSGRFEVS